MNRLKASTCRNDAAGPFSLASWCIWADAEDSKRGPSCSLGARSLVDHYQRSNAGNGVNVAVYWLVRKSIWGMRRLIQDSPPTHARSPPDDPPATGGKASRHHITKFLRRRRD
jgi:hypothetical protein